jgi:hypothetical protein
MARATISRTFSLHPAAHQRDHLYGQFKEYLIKFRDLENAYIALLMRALRSGRLKPRDFSGKSKGFIKAHIYTPLNLNQMVAPSYRSYELKERMKRCAIQYPYFAVRQWLIRTHHLESLARELSLLFQKRKAHIGTFLRGRPFSRAILKRFWAALQKDCFGKKTSLSYFFITNLVRQLKNRLLSMDLLEPCLKRRLNKVRGNKPLLRTYCLSCLNAFYRKKKGKKIMLSPSEVGPYLFKRYIAAVKRYSTWNAKKRLSSPELDEFKRQRDKEFLPVVDALQAQLTEFSGRDMKALLERVLSELLDKMSSLPQLQLTTYIFKPPFRSPRVDFIPSYGGFQSYLRCVAANKLKENLKELFLTEGILKKLTGSLKSFCTTIYEHIPPPKIKALAVPFNQKEQVYQPDFGGFTVKLSFIPREYYSLSIRDDSKRIQKMCARGGRPCLPVLTMEGHKLLLHVPFDVKRKSLSKPSSSLSPSNSPSSSSRNGGTMQDMSRKRKITMGVDLGVKYPAVLSIMDCSNPSKPRELARYFLNTRTLLDMKFNTHRGCFEPRARFKNPTSNTPSNQKLKLRHLRRETRHIQRKLHEYKHRCRKRGIKQPEERYKYNSLQRMLSSLWGRIRHCNEELIHLLNHIIIELANYHHVSVIHFENLKWSRHSRKSKTGAFLAFWQAHWFFSQVQEAVKLQAFMHRIRFRRVNAAYTSQRCSECGERGRLDSKLFRCKNTKKHRGGRIVELQSDLNAARNIALA